MSHMFSLLFSLYFNMKSCFKQIAFKIALLINRIEDANLNSFLHDTELWVSMLGYVKSFFFILSSSMLFFSQFCSKKI
jgi:hypothetical protein